MSETYNRSDRLYALARGCQINNLTPNHTNYIGFILHFATSKLSMSKETARSYAEDLKTAYDADQWQTILSGSEIETPAPSTTPQSEAETPSLNAYKTFTLTGPTEPIRHIAPKQATVETEYAPKTYAQILVNMARQNIFNGVGRLTLSEARYELSDKSLQTKDIIQLCNQYFPTVTIEQRPGNMLLFYFNNNLRQRVTKVIPDVAPVFAASKNEYFLEAPLETDATEYSDDEADIAEE